jgi:hypothetical protein
MKLEKKTYVHHYGMLEIDYASQVETKWVRKGENNGLATTSVDVFSQGKVESVWSNKEIEC